MLYKGQYIYPPRPQTAIKPFGPTYEGLKSKPSWTAQIKANGQRNGSYFLPSGPVEMWNRHFGQHENYVFPDWLVVELRGVIKIPADMWSVLDGELLHAKDRTIKNTLLFWDVLVLGNDYFFGSTYRSRYDRLMNITDAPKVKAEGGIYRISDHIWVSENIPSERWDETWKLTEISWVEGFVFKNLDGKLKPGFQEENNGDWMVRCRKKSSSGHVRY